MRVDLISDAAAFAALAEPWNECLAAMPGGNPFLCHQWLQAWWSVYGSGELMVLVVHDGGVIRAGAPLFTTHQPYYGMPMRQILFVGTHTFDRLSFLMRNDDREPVRAIWNQLHVACRGRTLVRLEGLPADHATLSTAVELSGVRADELSSHLPYIPIDRTWQAYRTGLTQKFRSEMRTRVKVFAAWGDWRLDICRGREVAQHLESLAALERASAKLMTGAAFLADARNRAFMAQLLAVTNPVEPVLLRLLIADRLAAYVVGFVHGGIFCAYNTAYHPDYEKGSPGKWIMDQAVAFAFAEGLREFDFLRGHFSYKDRWHPQVRESRRLVVLPPNPLGRLLRAGVFSLRPLLKRLRRGGEA